MTSSRSALTGAPMALSCSSVSRQALGVDVADRHLGARAGQLDGQRLPDARPAPVTTATFPANPSMSTLHFSDYVLRARS